jgi:hypothetical protein
VRPAQAAGIKARIAEWRNGLKAVATKEYLERVKLTVEQVHGCSARYVRSEHVKEVFEGKTVWEGDVEVFCLNGHAKAMWCYGWSCGEPEEFITMLELPPVDSAQSAVKVGVANQIKKSNG